MMKTLHIYTDGGCEPNPGNGVWAWVCKENNGDWDGEYVVSTTNQRMELQAIIEAIMHHRSEYCENQPVLSAPDYVLHIYSDSQYCTKGYNEWIMNWKLNGWKNARGKPVKNRDLWLLLDDLRDSKITIEWIRGHDGNEFNEKADRLVHEIFEENEGKLMKY